MACNLPERAGGRGSSVDGAGLEGAVTSTGDSPLGKVDLEKGKNIQSKGFSAKSFIIILISAYAFCLLTLFLNFFLKGVGAYLCLLKDNFILRNRNRG